MNIARLTLVVFTACAATLAGAAPSRSVTVVELFTSQGCSSCPPANANANALSERPDLLVLSFGVTYWDYLGWKDSFAKPEYTQRQRDYDASLGNPGVFTPQIVVDGRLSTVGDDRSDIESLIAASRRGDAASIAIADRSVSIGEGQAPGGGGADVWLVRYDPRTLEVPVRRGENSGRTLPHRNVVRTIEKIGVWDGRKASFRLPPADVGLRTAVLLQAPHGGSILAAAK